MEIKYFPKHPKMTGVDFISLVKRRKNESGKTCMSTKNITILINHLFI